MLVNCCSVEDMYYIFAWEFSGCFAGRVGYALFSLHTRLCRVGPYT